MNDVKIRHGATPPGSVTGCTAEQERRATLAVCTAATDPDDARVLLEHLGLVEPAERGR